MKKHIIHSKLAVTATLAVLLGALALLTTAGDQPGKPTLSDQLFAQRIAGSYLVDVPFFGIQVLFQVSADGGTLRVSDADAGRNGMAPFASRTAALGNWKRTGDRQIRAVEIGFEFDTLGLPLPLGEVGKVVVELEFADDWMSYSGTGKALFYAPGVDPIEGDPSGEFDFDAGYGRRVR